MNRVKFFRKNGRVCEEDLNPEDLLEIRDKMLQGYNDSSEEEIGDVQVTSPAPSMLTAKQ